MRDKTHDAIQVLYDEHQVIVNMIDVARHAATLIGTDDARYEKTVRELIRFFRTYADAYHHHKEEKILFPEMAKRNELLADGIINEMLDNHEDFRELIGYVELNLKDHNYTQTQKYLDTYTNTLLAHIAAENEELFPMAGSMMNDGELENIYFRFQDADRELGDQKKQELAGQAEMLRKQLSSSDSV